MKKIILIGLISYFGLSAYAQPNTEQLGIEVKPVTLEYSVTPGSSMSRKVYVTNALSEKTQFTVYVSDWRRDTTGSHVFSEPGKDPRSCASYITIDKTFLELASGERGELNITLQEPVDSIRNEQMSWCMLFIETVKEKKIGGATSFKTTIANRYRVGVHIYQTPPGVTEKEIRLLKIEPLATDRRGYRLTCQNTGATQLQCSGYIELFSIQDGSKMRLPSQEFPLFPEQVRYLHFILPEQLAKGKYILTGIIDAGNDVALEAGQLTIDID